VRFPCFLKPAYSHIWRKRYTNAKVITVNNKTELLSKASEICNLGLEVMVQEIIPGGDETIFSAVAFLNKESQPLAVCEKLFQPIKLKRSLN